jgi:proteasome lid subunit RPN8/RPN11
MGGGFFFGDFKDQYRIIKKIWPIKNVCIKDHRRHFSFDKMDLIKAKHFSKEWKMDLVGLFHSNPNCRALPSLKDLEIAFPAISLVIISLQNGVTQDWSSWQLNQETNSFLEEKVIL